MWPCAHGCKPVKLNGSMPQSLTSMRDLFKRLNLDLSPKMIEVAKQRSEGQANIDFQVVDIMEWEFPFKQFDAIASRSTLHHLPLERLLPNLKAALKPGGKLVILDLLKNESVQDSLSDVIAVPLNWMFQALRNQGIKPTAEAIKAVREHALTDKYLTRSQVQQICERTLPGATVIRHLFWRYSMVWTKS